MIQVTELTKDFQQAGRLFRAVDHVSFSVAPGETFGLLGPNGAGKTTTMRMILGLLPADHGYAAIDGFRSDQAPDEVKRRVGFISASAGIYQWLTGREILGFFGAIYGLSPQQVAHRIEVLIELLQLPAFLDQRCATLSTGQKQRINLARAMIHDPPVMIMDEPTLGLDVIGSQTVFEYIEVLKNQGKAVILCTHQLEQAQRVCDRFGLLFRSRMEVTGTLSELQLATQCRDLVEMFVMLIRKPDQLWEEAPAP